MKKTMKKTKTEMEMDVGMVKQMKMKKREMGKGMDEKVWVTNAEKKCLISCVCESC